VDTGSACTGGAGRGRTTGAAAASRGFISFAGFEYCNTFGGGGSSGSGGRFGDCGAASTGGSTRLAVGADAGVITGGSAFVGTAVGGVYGFQVVGAGTPPLCP
jgi:hypothetical protein